MPTSVIDQMRADAGQAQPSGSIVDQMRADATAPTPAAPAPAQSSGVLSQLSDAASAFGHHAMNLPHGAAQFVQHLTAGLAQTVAPNSKIANAIADTAMADDAALEQREKAYQARTPNSAGAYIGATAGEIAPFLVGGGLADGVKALGDVATNGVSKAVASLPAGLSKYVPDWATKAAAKGVGGAVQGGAISTAAPVTNGGDYGAQKMAQVGTGMAMGGALPFAWSGVLGAGSGVKNALAPIMNPQSVVSKALQNGALKAGLDPKVLADSIRNAPEYVPGSNPTTAQAGAAPFLVQAEKTVANNPDFKPQFMERDNLNNLARIQQLNQIAGQPGKLNELTQQRDAVANKLYGQAFEQGVDPGAMTPWVKGQVTQLLKRPAMQAAMNQAKTDAANEGIALTDDNSVQGLHFAKLALDKQIGKAFDSDNNVTGLLDTKNKLLTVLSKMSPAYDQARATYAEMSPPINSMEAGTQMINKLSGAALNSAGHPQITLPAYRSALAQALKNSDYGIEPQAEAGLRAIQDDLQRASISNSIKVPGSDTAFNLQAPGWLGRQIYGPEFDGKGAAAKAVAGTLGGIGGWLTGGGFGAAGGATAAMSGMNKLANMGSERVNKALVQALLDRDVGASMLEMPQGTTNPLLKNQLVRSLAGKTPEAVAYTTARQSK